MAKGFAEDLDLGFVKQNPWVLRDQELKRDAAAKAELERQAALVKEKNERGIEELEYGPGYVKKIRQHFLALATQSAPTTPLPSANSSLIRSKKRANVDESKEQESKNPESSSSSSSESGHKSEGQKQNEAVGPTSSDQQGQTADREDQSRAVTDDEPKSGPVQPVETRAQLSMAALVLEQVEIIGRELRKTSITTTDWPDEDSFGPTTVKSMKERFESGSPLKKVSFSIAYQTRRDQKDDVITGVKCLTLSLEQGGLDDFPFEFPVAEGLSYPPPTPFPLDIEIMDFESSVRIPRLPSSAESTQTESSGTLFSESGSWTIDFETTIRPPPVVPESTPVRPPDFWIKTPRRVPSPVTRAGDNSGLLEMKTMLSKFEQKRAKSPDGEQYEQKLQMDQAEILPNDPSPSVIPKHIREGISGSDDSFDFLCEDEEQESEEVAKVQLARADRLRPVKKRRVSIEIIGGGMVPRKTSLAQGPKFQRKEIEFSQQPPKAYAYLEESFASRVDEWVPGQELSLEQYREIRDEAKIERYKKLFASTPYFPAYEEDSPQLEETVVTPLNHNGYYPPVTVDDVYVIKLRAPEPPSRPPPPIPSSFDDEWYIRPPPAYPYPSPPHVPASNVAVSQH